jgi:hypothetical protein
MIYEQELTKQSNQSVNRLNVDQTVSQSFLEGMIDDVINES